MEPLTIDDLLLLLGRKEAQIAQLERHVRQLEATSIPLPVEAVVPVNAALNGER